MHLMTKLLCGHSHASYGHSQYEGKGSEFGDGADFSLYYSSGIFAVDASMFLSMKINVIVLEDYQKVCTVFKHEIRWKHLQKQGILEVTIQMRYNSLLKNYRQKLRRLYYDFSDHSL